MADEGTTDLEAKEDLLTPKEALEAVDTQVLHDRESSSGSEYEAPQTINIEGSVDVDEDVKLAAMDDSFPIEDKKDQITTEISSVNMVTKESVDSYNLAEASGEQFGAMYFPSNEEMVELKQYSNAALNVENSLKDLRSLEFKTKANREKVWESLQK